MWPIDKMLINGWLAILVNNPDWSPEGDNVFYEIRLEPTDEKGEIRLLKLQASRAGLHHDHDGSYRRRLFGCVEIWLATSNTTNGEIKCLGT